MSSSPHSPKSIESEVKSIKTLLKEVSQAVQMISFRQLENETKINELAKAQEEKSQKSKKSLTHASKIWRWNHSKRMSHFLLINFSISVFSYANCSAQICILFLKY